jgi:hypothetical protein
MKELMGRTGRKAAAVAGSMATTARRITLPLLAVALLSATGMTVSAASANAQITSPGFASAKSARPDVDKVLMVFKDGTTHNYDCTDGMTWNVKATVTTLDNGCHSIVFTHINAGGGGTKCYNSGADAHPNAYVYNLYISSRSSCPA